MKPIQQIGCALLAVGLIWLLIAFNMDTSVATGGGVYGVPSRIENIGLIAQRQNHILVSCFISLAGILLILFGGQGANPPISVETDKGDLADEVIPDRDINSDPYRLWLSRHYNVQRNDVFNRFTLGEKTFETLEGALAHAHRQELEKVEQERIAKEKAVEEARGRKVEDELREEKTERVAKVIMIAVVVAAILGSPFLYISMKNQEAQRIAQRDQAAKEAGAKLQELGIVKSNDMTELEMKKVAADSDDKTWCDAGAGTLITFSSTKKPEEIISSLTEGAEITYSHGDETLISRTYTDAKNKRFSLSVFPGKSTSVYLCQEQ